MPSWSNELYRWQYDSLRGAKPVYCEKCGAEMFCSYRANKRQAVCVPCSYVLVTEIAAEFEPKENELGEIAP